MRRIEDTRSIAAAAVAAAVLAACGPKTPCDDPEEVVTRLYVSIFYGDTAMAYELISGADKRALKGRASASSVPGGKAPAPHELLVPGLVDLPGDLGSATFKARKVEVGDTREVEIRFDGGSVTVVPVEREAGCYRVPLGLPK